MKMHPKEEALLFDKDPCGSKMHGANSPFQR
jgi:hypothetical protein